MFDQIQRYGHEANASQHTAAAQHTEAQCRMTRMIKVGKDL